MHYKINTKMQPTEILLLQTFILFQVTCKVKLKTEYRKFHNWGTEQAIKPLIQTELLKIFSLF